jgi:hypothetical protein
MNLRNVGYALLCIVVPLAWGLLVVWASARIEERLNKRKPPQDGSEKAPMPPIEYHI